MNTFLPVAIVMCVFVLLFGASSFSNHMAELMQQERALLELLSNAEPSEIADIIISQRDELTKFCTEITLVYTWLRDFLSTQLTNGDSEMVRFLLDYTTIKPGYLDFLKAMRTNDPKLTLLLAQAKETRSEMSHLQTRLNNWKKEKFPIFRLLAEDLCGPNHSFLINKSWVISPDVQEIFKISLCGSRAYHFQEYPQKDLSPNANRIFETIETVKAFCYDSGASLSPPTLAPEDDEELFFWYVRTARIAACITPIRYAINVLQLKEKRVLSQITMMTLNNAIFAAVHSNCLETFFSCIIFMKAYSISNYPSLVTENGGGYLVFDIEKVGIFESMSAGQKSFGCALTAKIWLSYAGFLLISSQIYCSDIRLILEQMFFGSLFDEIKMTIAKMDGRKEEAMVYFDFNISKLLV